MQAHPVLPVVSTATLCCWKSLQLIFNYRKGTQFSFFCNGPELLLIHSSRLAEHQYIPKIIWNKASKREIKPDSGMLLMRKDMGGAAVALTAARMILEAKLPVRLRLLLPIVENAISGCAFRPGDVYRSRKGLTVEIGNTDAEGRLILADALALADEESPDLLIDFATLTGAARVALGPDLPAFFTVDDDLAAAVDAAARAERDPVWRLPLWKPYRSMLDSRFADLNNVGGGGMAGAVTAALFLARFIENARAHVHFDLFGWTPSARPGRPEGGETQTARLVARLVEEQFVKGNTKS